MDLDESFANFNSGLTIPTPERVRNKNLAPIIILICKTIQGHHSVKFLVLVFDDDSSSSLLNVKNTPRGATSTLSDRKKVNDYSVRKI